MLPEVNQSQDVAARLRAALAGVMEIQDMTLGKSEGYAARFRGRLVIDSVEAYRRASEAFRLLDHTAHFRREGDLDVILALPGTIPVRESRVWINALLFAVTILSVLFTGGAVEYNGPLTNVSQVFSLLARGVPFALAMLSILGAHELGHYFAARYHNVQVTLPY